MTKRISQESALISFNGRWYVAVALFFLAAVVLVGRAVHLQVLDRGFLSDQGDARHLRVAKISAHRGTITDRNGEPLAVSTPVDSIWANPSELALHVDDFPRLAESIGEDQQWLLRRITRNLEREFVYLRRHMSPEGAARVKALDIPGVYLLREYRRYYPAGEVAGHVLGFTNIDDVGQEGLELAYDHWLRGEPGAKRVLKDRLGRSVEDLESIKPPRPGKDLVTSLDLGIQYLAYRELKASIQRNNARSGSVVVLDVATGEVLAMVNQPSYNPNDRAQYSVSRYRNRAVTDILEPGSSFKPFVVAAALESGMVKPDSLVQTSPGFITVGAKVIEDKHNLGEIDVTTVLTKSSNVGAAKIAMALEPIYLWQVLTRFGLGSLTASGFPGESAGLLNDHNHWRSIGQATLAYGYGVSVTPLQLAQGYATIGSRGARRPVSLLKLDHPQGSEKVIGEQTAAALVTMMETVVSPEGTGSRAAVPGYRVAGKTGTSWKFKAGGYSKDKYFAVFAGLAPASDARLAIVVVIDEPSSGKYYGGEVAAPVFSTIMAGALRLQAVAPDALPERSSEKPLVQAMSRATPVSP